MEKHERVPGCTKQQTILGKARTLFKFFIFYFFILLLKKGILQKVFKKGTLKEGKKEKGSKIKKGLPNKKGNTHVGLSKFFFFFFCWKCFEEPLVFFFGKVFSFFGVFKRSDSCFFFAVEVLQLKGAFWGSFFFCF